MINKVTLLGRLGKDSKLVKTKDGKNILLFSVATSDKYKKDGQAKETTEWHDIIQSDPLASTLHPFLTKGKLVYIEGKLNYSKFEKDGVQQIRAQIVSSVIKICDSKESMSRVETSHVSISTNSQDPRQNPTHEFFPESFSDSDLPF